ncbi:polyphosphate polymerase domain-containing protein [Ruminiclostridium herbifermentans]|uniref:Polyphosphate polymerase domain-containing protein n=1 Tax=Ruminiclostridium herbifermentans TaxID=2488810 RepID=A0A4U7JJ77_9FIRM|nr:polyphosphate polymerase domain-containing protein [Ruminiclostridium herbifermentans]QNU66107.1 polyphosphate polymerase domain-containing protein [Ruminiclostridium herbifermentans]
MTEPKGRYEIKHYINYADMMQLRARLPFIAALDKNAIEDNGYRVKSLYFDNYKDKALIEKINGVNEREKFRLRLYNNDTSFIRLEKKSKKNGICYKQSVSISEKECKRLLDGKLDVLKENGSPICLELYTKMHYQQLRAKSIVDYRREAYIYPIGNVRVTMDYDIRASNNVQRFLEPEPVLVPISEVYILEVKYDNFLPEIIRGIVSLSSRRSTAFSKYAVTRII